MNTSVNAAPAIEGDSVLNVTVGVQVNYTITATDRDGDMVTLYLRSALPDGAYYKNISADTGVLYWTPQDRNPVNIT